MSQFRNLVFEGGGVKGIAYAGAIDILAQHEILPDIVRVAGTSAGAITAALLAAGATGEDVERIVGGTSFSEFMDASGGFLRNAYRLFKHYGWYKGDAFSRWMKKQMGELTGGCPGLTFRQLAEMAAAPPAADARRCRELSVVVTNLSKQAPQALSAETAPDMPIWQAVRMSMSVPLFFQSVRLNGEVMLDGGVTWNYPIDLFDDMRYLSDPQDERTHVRPDYPTLRDGAHVYNKETLGFRVDTLDEIKASKDAWRLPPKTIDNIKDYMSVCVGFMSDMANKIHLHKNDWHRTVFIDAGGVQASDFNLSDDKIQLLVDNGRKHTTGYFDWFDNPGPDDWPLNRVS